ncbi:thioredoxin-like protein [Aureobasidium subglaciale]|nr:thioredoxin-like protein [Aureobasidium subglaciale]
MVYESQISFTLDTICPWTYLARRRLSKALTQVRSTDPGVTFTVKYLPYQLYPKAPQEGEDKYSWYRDARFNGDEEHMRKYAILMTAYGKAEGIAYKFGGKVGNTLQAHRVIQLVQETKGYDAAEKVVDSLYKQYFEEERHPSSEETLLRALTEAGLGETEAKKIAEDQDEGLMDVKMLIREQAGNGVDAVPYVVFEGKRRDFTLEGCKEVDEYVKVLQQVIKEST